MLENNRVVVLGGGDVRSCELDVAVKMGLQVSYIGDTTFMEHLKDSPNVTFYDEDITETEKCLQALKNGPEDMDIDAVVSFTENALLTASAMAKKLRANANSLFPVVHTKDKTRMRALLQKDSELALPFAHCETEEQAQAFFTEHGTAILKPMYGAGSIGVCKIESAEAITDYFANYEFDTILMEKFVEGDEFSVESLSFEGDHLVCAITQKMTTGAPHFVEMGHTLPALIDADVEQRIKDKVERFLDLIQQQDGPAHTEVKVDNGEVYIIESQTRVGGDQITTLFELSTGFNLFEETYKLLLDDDYELPQINTERNAQIRYIKTDLGVLKGVDGVDDAKNLPGVHLVKINKALGTVMGPIKGSPDRLGYVVTSGDSPEEAAQSMSSALECIKPSIAANA